MLYISNLSHADVLPSCAGHLSAAWVARAFLVSSVFWFRRQHRRPHAEHDAAATVARCGLVAPYALRCLSSCRNRAFYLARRQHTLRCVSLTGICVLSVWTAVRVRDRAHMRGAGGIATPLFLRTL